MSDRVLNKMDGLIAVFDAFLKQNFYKKYVIETCVNYPAQDIEDCIMTTVERSHVAGLMRINHVGEVCAQGLYQGQALTASAPETIQLLLATAQEEQNHLNWCAIRISELGGERTSYLAPIWYAGSVTLGVVAGLLGDPFNLGFVTETERQVEQHIDKHLNEIPSEDNKTRAVLEQMKEDEIKHGQTAWEAGGVELPSVVKKMMHFSSRVMVVLTYRI